MKQIAEMRTWRAGCLVAAVAMAVVLMSSCQPASTSLVGTWMYYGFRHEAGEGMEEWYRSPEHLYRTFQSDSTVWDVVTFPCTEDTRTQAFGRWVVCSDTAYVEQIVYVNQDKCSYDFPDASPHREAFRTRRFDISADGDTLYLRYAVPEVELWVRVKDGSVQRSEADLNRTEPYMQRLTRNALYTPNERQIEASIGLAVTDIYETVFDWYNNHQVFWEEHRFDDDFLTVDLLALQAVAGAIGTERDEMPPGMDFDHWVQAQDYGRMDFSVDSINVHSRDSGEVFLTIQNDGFRTPVLLRMARKKGCQPPAWCIDDFVTAGWQGEPYAFSVKCAMREYVAEHPTDTITPQYETDIRRRITEMYAEMIAACQKAKQRGEVQSLYAFNTNKNLSEAYLRLYTAVDSIDAPKDLGNRFFFNREHWGLNLEQDGIREAEVVRVNAHQDSTMAAPEADVVVRLTCESYYLSSDTLVTYANVRLHLVYERGDWYVDDFPQGNPPLSEKEEMAAYIRDEHTEE